MREKFRRTLRGRGGYTLTEMVVTFALLAIFSVALLYVITASSNIYSSASGHAYAQTVSETILEKVSGEISDAQPGAQNQYGVTVLDGSGQIAGGAGEGIAFCGRTGSQVYIVTADGQVLIHYRPVEDNSRHLKAVDWTFDDAVYHGFRVESLTFSIVQKDGANTNVIRMQLTLKNEKTGFTYEAERYAQCYNFSDIASASKITYGPIPADGN
jgi:hypothetical protein